MKTDGEFWQKLKYQALESEMVLANSVSFDTHALFDGILFKHHELSEPMADLLWRRFWKGFR